MKEYDDCIKTADKALDLNIRSRYKWDLVKLKAQAFDKKKQREKMVQVYQSFASDKKTHARYKSYAYYYVGEVYRRLKDKKAAKKAYEKVINLKGGHPRYKKRAQRRLKRL